jgi:hypothetical protein
MIDRLYLLKIRLLDIEPEIWRRFVVPADITLDRLHDVIQIVMGWQDYHLHEFFIGDQRYTEGTDTLEFMEDSLEDGLYRLNDLVKRKGARFSYNYDFGDYWQHELIVENSRYSDPEIYIPVQCIEGERACPPEDVGGVGGYEYFCESVSNPEREEYESLNLWYDSFPWYETGFDSERFDIDKINLSLAFFIRCSRDRLKPW